MTVSLRLLPLRALGATTLGLLAWSALRNAAQASADATVVLASLAVAVAVAFGVEDEAATLVAAVPTPLWVRRAWRVGPLVVWAGVTWLAVRSVAGPIGGALTPTAVRAMLLVTLSLAATLTFARRDEASAALAGSLTVVVVLAAAYIAPTWWPVLAPGGDAWTTDALRVGAVALVLGWAGLRDPGRTRLLGAVRASGQLVRSNR